MKIHLTGPTAIAPRSHPGWSQGPMNPSHPRLPARVERVTHVYVDHVLGNFLPQYIPDVLRGVWSRCTPGATVGVVDVDYDQAARHEERARNWGVELTGALQRAGRWPNRVYPWNPTPDAVRELLERSGLHCVRQVDIYDGELNNTFHVTRHAAWQCAFLAEVKEPSS